MTTDIQLGHEYKTYYQVNQRDIHPRAVRQRREGSQRVLAMEGDEGKLTKLELLRQDYRTRLLHEKEQKLNELFDRKIQATTTCSATTQGSSVREFFLHRRRVASTTKIRQHPTTLPPIKTANTRYEEARLSKKRNVEERTREHEILDTGKRKENKTKGLSELAKLRQQRRQVVAQHDERNIQEIRAESKEKEALANEQRKNHDRERTLRPRRHLRRSSREPEVYKRGQKELLRQNDNSCEKVDPQSTGGSRREKLVISENKFARSEELSSSDENLLSRSLARIKELSRRRTEEYLKRSISTAVVKPEVAAITKTTTKDSATSNRLEEMRRLELELRETITREQKKLHQLQKQKQQTITETSGRERRSSSTIGVRKQQPRRKMVMQQTKSKDSAIGSEAGLSTEMSARSQAQVLQSRVKVESKSSDHENSAGLVTCSNCGRSFMKERIVRHENACKKASSRKKKPFDSRKKRAQGTELDKYVQNERGMTYEPSDVIATAFM